jgi:hypothetical protein
VFIRRLVHLIAPFVLIAILIGGFGEAAHADNTIPPSTQWAEIFPPFFNLNAPKCLDNVNGSNSVDNPQQVFHCHGYASNGAPQRWQLFNRGTGDNPYYEIRNVGSNQCLFARTNLRVVQEPCNEQFGGLWRVVPTPNVGPYFALSSLAFFGGCLATGDSSGNDHTSVFIASCNFDNQNDITWIRQVWSFG